MDDLTGKLKVLLDRALTYESSFPTDDIKGFPRPDLFLEGMRPFFERGAGDFTGESGYPKLRKFYGLFACIEKGLTLLAQEPAWRNAFTEFQSKHGYSACPADWGLPPLLVGVNLFSNKTESGLRFALGKREPNYPWLKHPAGTGSPTWPIARHEIITEFIKSFPVDGLC